MVGDVGNRPVEGVDVIPVRMGDEDGSDLPTSLGHHLVFQWANPGPGVEDQSLASGKVDAHAVVLPPSRIDLQTGAGKLPRAPKPHRKVIGDRLA